MNFNSDIISDAVKVGLANVVFMTLVMKVFPTNLPAQMFIGGTLFHMTMETFKVKHWYLEQPEYK